MHRYRKISSYLKRSSSRSNLWALVCHQLTKTIMLRPSKTSDISNNQWNIKITISMGTRKTMMNMEMSLSTNRISKIRQMKKKKLKNKLWMKKKKPARKLRFKKYSIDTKITIFKGYLCNKWKTCRCQPMLRKAKVFSQEQRACQELLKT